MYSKGQGLAFQMAVWRGLGTQPGCVKGRVVNASWVEFVPKRNKKSEKVNRQMPLHYVHWGNILRHDGSPKPIWKMYFGNKQSAMCFCEAIACSITYCLVYMFPTSLSHWSLSLILPNWDCTSAHSPSIWLSVGYSLLGNLGQGRDDCLLCSFFPWDSRFIFL